MIDPSDWAGMLLLLMPYMAAAYALDAIRTTYM